VEAPGLAPLARDWHWRADVALVLLLLGVAYVRGFVRLRRQGGAAVAPAWRLAAYLAGLGSVALALLSPIGALAHVLFTAHMVQHQLLMMGAAPFLLLGNPFPFVMWALPPGRRRAIRRWLTARGALRRALRTVTWPPVAGLVYALALWGWHVPAAYEAALAHPVTHDLEHLSFFGAAVVFWWPVVNPAPRSRGPRGGLYYGVRIGYLVLATAQNTLLGALLGLTERVLYPSYARDSGLFGLSPVDDQALGGGIMWSGGHMYLVAILVLLAQAMAGERDRQPAEPIPPA
jgi:putative membrane protein